MRETTENRSPRSDPGLEGRAEAEPGAAAELAALVARVRSGDGDADEELVLRFHEKAFLMALVRTGSRETARDLAQETMLSVLEAVRNGRLREPERLPGYVYGTARNLVHEHLRSREARCVPLDRDVASLSDPEADAEGAERRFLVHRVLRALGASDRLVLLLGLVDGLSASQIAERLGTSADAARQRKSRALRRARELIARLSRSGLGWHLPSRRA